MSISLRSLQARTARSNAPRAAKGFTLIEVLMGVLVLGLGLLGLAAVFPAVVLQQRQAGDAVEGEGVALAAESMLRGTEAFTGVVRDAGPPAGTYAGAINSLTRDAAFSPFSQWEANPTTADAVFAVDSLNGALNLNLRPITFSGTGTPTPLARTIPVSQRVIPAVKRPEGAANDVSWREVAQRGDEPRFIWDATFRRVKALGPLGPSSTGDAVQAAIFVRRIDTGIRAIGDAQPLSRRLLGGNILPIAVDANGVPQLNGVGEYSTIQVATADRFSERELQLDTPVLPANLRPFLAQVGQKLVIGDRDSEPGVYEVRSVRRAQAPATGLFIELDKNLPRSLTNDPDITVVFTPQIPVAVKLVKFGD
jgi:prepilin-type N-terminal cleavage/methylation domain-containing protein